MNGDDFSGDGAGIFDRRSVIAAGSLLSLALSSGVAMAAEALRGDELPLRTTGLEHIGMLVPDVTKAAQFYGRLFNPAVHKEADPPLRYYVVLGKGYIALGSRATAPDPAIDHYCVLLEKYDRKAMDARLEREGLAPAMRGIVYDPDHIGLQLLEEPAGLASTTVPAGNIVEGAPLVTPLKMESILLRVSDLAATSKFMSLFFKEMRAPVPGQRWFAAANTPIAIRQTVGREKPAVDDWTVSCRRFDSGKVAAALAQMGAVILPSAPGTLRLLDPNGLPLTMKMAG
ncbi:catechol 2,3-dioxygenase-like lactoylglutathione lyase family enzyme [Sphingobium sp. B11D3B]|uniref:VOC family protein n=1 Tax=unclassified Sphingobium TaxID=2611147 RepID=UPI00222528BD|nr:MULTISPECIES: VOC family protein [unclassified Sphingobium]MCW2390138.1 catechol 2,3-dioxygenase-like lactoylglutathione lyase family enzyme [Sphingobium sp. B11D3B]MCW2410906.1 catechol 2,3-dioxygenase-like lactoylglutathione lyase family enzyme [Sphingobium sp. B8D3D]MCW2416803.1 catechol 2,3-dioxygenase-like lactoylglutathione lyase family enzyme [Sphingobium sp. B8D3A]